MENSINEQATTVENRARFFKRKVLSLYDSLVRLDASLSEVKLAAFNSSELAVRLELLERAQASFDLAQNALEEIDYNEIGSETRDNFDERFLEVKSRVRTHFDSRERQLIGSPTSRRDETIDPSANGLGARANRRRLPELKLPTFGGDYKEVRPNTIPDLKVDATFRQVPKHALTFELWKIDEVRLEAVARAQYGTFYDNCAYIIYASSLVGHYANHETITREQKPNVPLERYIHYWLGSNISEQNRSNVVHKIQELDSYLGNVASIYRETQNHESARFLSYFKKGYDVLSGALINSVQKVRLFQLYGRKWLHAIELAEIEWSHFNSDYIMVLQMEAITFVWIGRSSASIERRSAVAWVQRQRGKDSGTICIVGDGYEQSMSAEHKQAWNMVLPLQQRRVFQSNQQLDSNSYDSKINDDINGSSNKFRIYKCNQRGRLHLDQLHVGMPSKDDLSDAHGVYLLDNYGQSIWLWVGAQATQADALTAMGNGRAFVKKKKYANSTLVVRVLEGQEPVEFKRLFGNWLTVWQDSTRGHKPVSIKFGKFGCFLLCELPKMAADTQLVDDGRGERVLYRIFGDQLVELPATKVTFFTTNSSYVVKYTVQCATVVAADLASVGVKSIIYQRNGSEASAETIAKADNFAMAIFESMQGAEAMFVQLYEFNETPHFLQLFEGKLIIMRGQRSELLRSNNNHNWDFKTNIMLETFLLKIYGDASYNSKAVEEHPLSAISSKDCYNINSRPFLSISESPDDLDVLTPAHLLFGGPPTVILEPDLTMLDYNRLDGWQRVTQLQQVFWKRWREEYLTLLQQRSKWRTSDRRLQVNDLVLVKDENLPPLRWPLARVMALIPGKDGECRVADLKTTCGSTGEP
ncbi:LOW QUALITY PROTEIN: villin-like protein quail [Drosophila albomicans]|uniref:LOW QUALITY PROTEIN: villin-like protein quail n=1 Tax=Drosophila albomicans TaxID=7291 RepID=A0A6P8ZFF8_DROAB|nr:LOW QUALITY PROTEIN: villin-like protein quail [Drosophila albomicans]